MAYFHYLTMIKMSTLQRVKVHAQRVKFPGVQLRDWYLRGPGTLATGCEQLELQMDKAFTLTCYRSRVMHYCNWMAVQLQSNFTYFLTCHNCYENFCFGLLSLSVNCCVWLFVSSTYMFTACCFCERQSQIFSSARGCKHLFIFHNYIKQLNTYIFIYNVHMHAGLYSFIKLPR